MKNARHVNVPGENVNDSIDTRQSRGKLIYALKQKGYFYLGGFGFVEEIFGQGEGGADPPPDSGRSLSRAQRKFRR